MSRVLIIARMLPGSEGRVGRIFAESDATSLPSQIGVSHRSLYSFGDVYIHLMELGSGGQGNIQRATDLPAFRQIGEDLKPFISPYHPDRWRGPKDAMAKEFYHWEATGTQ